MYAVVILIALALTFKIARDVLAEVIPFELPNALGTTVAVALASGFAYAIDYSVFAAFGQGLREAWMHPVLTGAVLVAAGEFIPSLVNAVSGKAVDVTSQFRTIKAA